MARNSNNRSNRNRQQNQDQDVLNDLVNVTPVVKEEVTMETTPNEKIDIPPTPTVEMLQSGQKSNTVQGATVKMTVDEDKAHINEFVQVSYQLYNNTRCEKMSRIVGVERTEDMKDVKGKVSDDKMIDVFILDRSTLRITHTSNPMAKEASFYTNMSTGYNQVPNLILGSTMGQTVFYKHNSRQQEAFSFEDGQVLKTTIQRFDTNAENKFVISVERSIGEPLYLEAVYRTTKDSDRSDEHLNSILARLIGNMKASILYAVKQVGTVTP